MLAKSYSASFKCKQLQKLFLDKVHSAPVRKFIVLNHPLNFINIIPFLNNNEFCKSWLNNNNPSLNKGYVAIIFLFNEVSRKFTELKKIPAPIPTPLLNLFKAMLVIFYFSLSLVYCNTIHKLEGFILSKFILYLVIHYKGTKVMFKQLFIALSRV